MKKQKVVISKETATYAAKELTALFPKLDKEPEYSLGFQRWTKLTKAQRNTLMITYNFVYNDVISHLEKQDA